MNKEWFGMSVDLLNNRFLLRRSYRDGREIDPKRYPLTSPQVADLITEYKAINYVHSAFYFIGVHHALTRGANS